MRIILDTTIHIIVGAVGAGAVGAVSVHLDVGIVQVLAGASPVGVARVVCLANKKLNLACAGIIRVITLHDEVATFGDRNSCCVPRTVVDYIGLATNRCTRKRGLQCCTSGI
jgi:hypothetical protein